MTCVLQSQFAPQDGICCSCMYHEAEETPCDSREDKMHCVHWWEGAEGEEATKTFDGDTT